MKTTKEGSLGAPTRHAVDWKSEAFYDPDALDAETRRIFDICHGCRRCFNLCDSFPRLFDLIDDSNTGELDSVESGEFGSVVDACTLCDMCFMIKCPYVPPHEFDLDFPHLMLRHRAVAASNGSVSRSDKELAKTDRNGKFAAPLAALVNWSVRQKPLRQILQSAVGISSDAPLPQYSARSMQKRWAEEAMGANDTAPANGRKAVIYATCHMNYSDPDLGLLAQKLLAMNGVETEFVYPECCGMPQLEQGDLASVAGKAKNVAATMRPWIDQGYQIIALVPSCSLMLKMEWPLIAHDDDDVLALAGATKDITEYLVDIAKGEGLSAELLPVSEKTSLHMACHARAQNMGRKAEELLALIPKMETKIIERCSGHGGAWGVKNDNFDIAKKIGRPVIRATAKAGTKYVVSECPLAAQHIHYGLDENGEAGHDGAVRHPLEIFARSIGIY